MKLQSLASFILQISSDNLSLDQLVSAAYIWQHCFELKLDPNPDYVSRASKLVCAEINQAVNELKAEKLLITIGEQLVPTLAGIRFVREGNQSYLKRWERLKKQVQRSPFPENDQLVDFAGKLSKWETLLDEENPEFKKFLGHFLTLRGKINDEMDS